MTPIASAGPLHVLVVDDDALDRMAAARALRQLDERPVFEEADGADAALEKMRQKPFDIVLIDYMLGDTTALDFLPTLRREFPDSAAIVLTGHAEASIAVELMKAGASDFIAKAELSPDTLERSLRYTTRLKISERALARLEGERRRHLERLNDLVTGAASIIGQLTAEGVLSASAAKAAGVLEGSSACSAFVDQNGVEQVHTHELASALDERAVGMWSRVWDHARELSMPQMLSRAEHPDLFTPEDSTTSLLLVPLPRQEAVRAGFVAVARDDSAPWRDSDMPLLAQLAQLTAVSLENARSYQIAQRAVRTREEVLAVVSHDLRTPLSNLRLACTTLRQIVPNASEAASVVTRIERTTTHMKRLVDELLAISRVDAGTFSIEPGQVLVNSLVEAAAQLARPLAEAASVTLDVAFTEPDAVVVADRTRVLQVFSNLLANAFKFTPRGGHVRLSAELEHEAGAVKFFVSDTGPGMSEEVRARVFDRFWQGPTPQRSKGTGLGLYIAREVVLAHGGSIVVESAPGAGTTFSFSLPHA